ncbi:putative WRKY transcription factor 69-like [Dorcoceras hygrometricum]|uniref:Putative WRKY transcription factor 69-like n=1 Tax=Dorcoceras hygrometricum TaxID=472368 RepID=A0A2Z6ZXI4_9LAMI|nr:putative WRKY transcription factor 69-like [Dorcoceras hygrometricum]
MRSAVASHGPGSNPRGNAICNAILLQCFRFYRSSVFNILDRHCPPSSDVLPLNLDIAGASPERRPAAAAATTKSRARHRAIVRRRAASNQQVVGHHSCNRAQINSSRQRQTCATMREAAPHNRPHKKRGKRAVIARIIAQPIVRDDGQRSDSELRIHVRNRGIQQANARP